VLATTTNISARRVDGPALASATTRGENPVLVVAEIDRAPNLLHGQPQSLAVTYDLLAQPLDPRREAR